MKTSRILVTGAGGFIGRHLIAELAKGDNTIFAIGRSPAAWATPVRQYVGDLADATFVENCVADAAPAVIFHLAAYKERSVGPAALTGALATNLTGSLNLLNAARSLKDLQAIVALGTAEEYGTAAWPFAETARERPISPYSFSKLCMTNLCQLYHSSYGLPAVVLRPSLAYGPGQPDDMFLPALIKTLLAGEPFPMTAGGQSRDYIYIADLVQAMLLAAAENGAHGEVINIGAGESVRLRDLAAKVATLLGAEELLKIGQIPYRQKEIMEYVLNTDKARALLGWLPAVPLEAGLEATLRYYRDGGTR